MLSWSSPHPISSSQLHVLPHFHPCPIDLVVFKGVYSFRMGYLILRGASRLDAFSVYPFRAWLPGYRLGSLTGAPAARPSRSSRTKDSSSQISYETSRSCNPKGYWFCSWSIRYTRRDCKSIGVPLLWVWQPVAAASPYQWFGRALYADID